MTEAVKDRRQHASTHLHVVTVVRPAHGEGDWRREIEVEMWSGKCRRGMAGGGKPSG
jgi:hypothetical protein